MSFPFNTDWRIGDLLPTADTARPANHWLFLTRVKNGYAERNRQRPCRLLIDAMYLSIRLKKQAILGQHIFSPRVAEKKTRYWRTAEIVA